MPAREGKVLIEPFAFPQYNELFEKGEAAEETPNRLVLDFDEEAKKSLVSVHKNFVKILKPHQVGVSRGRTQVMWSSVLILKVARVRWRLGPSLRSEGSAAVGGDCGIDSL